ncbi:MAG: hypothetical protein PUJ57_03345 [Peptoniphilaceae bacterium]|nr:hypothetical protein [Peptoniphilaceae bacterium]MDY6085832.1 hypothetical protein [Peptoniphilaceae bacterium]
MEFFRSGVNYDGFEAVSGTAENPDAIRINNKTLLFLQTGGKGRCSSL